jgi:hypothetical protein
MPAAAVPIDQRRQAAEPPAIHAARGRHRRRPGQDLIPRVHPPGIQERTDFGARRILHADSLRAWRFQASQELARRTRRSGDAVCTAEVRLPTHDAVNLLASCAATLDQAEAANVVDGLDRHRQNPLAGPGYSAGFTGHGTMVMLHSVSPRPSIVHLKGRKVVPEPVTK